MHCGIVGSCGERKCKDKTAGYTGRKNRAEDGRKKTEQKTEQKTQNKSEDKQKAEAPKVTGDELSEMVNEFSSLKDGDPKKKSSGEALRLFFLQAEQVN